jgi:hypothetical protein
MKEFVFIYRNYENAAEKPSPEEMQASMAEWMSWFGSIAAQNKLASYGNRLSPAGANTVRPGNVVTDGPYTEIKEFITGFSIVKADTLEEATELAKGCPIYKVGGTVEVRTVMDMNALK